MVQVVLHCDDTMLSWRFVSSVLASNGGVTGERREGEGFSNDLEKRNRTKVAVLSKQEAHADSPSRDQVCQVSGVWGQGCVLHNNNANDDDDMPP